MVHRLTCTSHCANCGEHFHGLGAFDLHRRGGECLNPGAILGAEGTKREGTPLLQIWTHDGSCDKEVGCWRDGKRVRWSAPVTVWQVVITDAQRERLSEAWGRKSDGSLQPALLDGGA